MAVEQKTIEKVVTISARPETVFGYFTDPVKYVRWKGKRANLDPRPGGVFEVEFDKGEIARGEFVEVRRNQRVVFTWGWVGSATCPPGASRVEVDLAPVAGGTRLRLVHSGLPEAEVQDHAKGWEQFLSRLVEVARD